MLLSRVGRTQLPLPRGIKFIDAIAFQLPPVWIVTIARRQA